MHLQTSDGLGARVVYVALVELPAKVNREAAVVIPAES
jgi:hypothetical protein